MKFGMILAMAALTAGFAFGLDTPLKRADIRIRDPFVLAENGVYYLYAATGNPWQTTKAEPDVGVMVYRSENLEDWAKPERVCTIPVDWRVAAVWAPEVHKYNGKYYLFATMNYTTEPKVNSMLEGWHPQPMLRRGTCVFVSDSPMGPFKKMKDGSHTPSEWLALDGTLWVEKDVPYMVFCHEWLQLRDGTIDVMELKPDLSDAVTKPEKLFPASSAPDHRTDPNAGLVTDGPFVYRSPKSGKLFMIWSTFANRGGYNVQLAESASGSVKGPWKQRGAIYAGDSGHGMIFKRFDGQLMLSLHGPNASPKERAHFIPLEDTGDGLKVKP